MNDLTVADVGIPTGIALRDPETILKEAQERACALTKMVEQTKSFTQIGPSKHLRVEAWITIGQFYGCSARVTDTQEISIGGVTGFKAHAKVTHDASGQVLTEADSLCMQDEDNWSNKPLFQLMSMAQTRALSKALAAKFRWVVVLGGYAATPAEEMTGRERETSQQSDHKSSKSSPAPKLPFGHSKGKAIDDPEVPLGDLTYMLEYVEKNIGSDKRKNYKAQDEKFLAALQAEITKRQAAPKQAAGQPEQAQGAMEPDAWVDYCALQLSMHEAEYTQACMDFKVQDPTTLPVEAWGRFQAHMKVLTAKK